MPRLPELRFNKRMQLSWVDVAPSVECLDEAPAICESCDIDATRSVQRRDGGAYRLDDGGAVLHVRASLLVVVM